MAERSKTPRCGICRTLRFNSERISSHLLAANVIVPPTITQKIKSHVITIYSGHSKMRGLENRSLPENYVCTRYNDAIRDNTHRFVLKFIVLDFLTSKLDEHGVTIAHHPRLESITTREDGGLIYKFRISTIVNIKVNEWEKLNFTPPRRKLYKDLDRQAKSFLQQEAEKEFPPQDQWIIEGEDWVGFKVELLNKSRKPSLRGHHNNFLMKISTKYLVSPFQRSFLTHKVGDSFIVNTFPDENTNEDILSTKGTFLVTILSIVKGQHFCLDLFQSTFKLTSEKETHEQLIEIFSYRNDISQRRSIIEEVFRILFSCFRFEIPRHLILRREEELLHNVRKLPDYHVYKAHISFSKQLELLAEKQLKEEILIDRISQEENIKITTKDISEYLNLFAHERLLEFIYFRPELDNIGESSSPIREEIFRNTTRREKALNHVIHTLSHIHSTESQLKPILHLAKSRSLS